MLRVKKAKILQYDLSSLDNAVEFLKGVFNFNLFTKVPVLVRSCLLETPTPNWDALFTDCTIEFLVLFL
jgi:hypothetical protein